MSFPKRGEIWLVNLNSIKGHEQAGICPVMVFSVNQFNKTKAELVIVIPITTANRGIPLHIEILPQSSNLKEISYIKCEDIRLISTERLMKSIGNVSENILKKVEEIVKMLLGMDN